MGLGHAALSPGLGPAPGVLLYRQYYFWRYRALFRSRYVVMATSALTFSFLHLMYDNIIAVALALTLIGGVIFTWSYEVSGRLRVPWIEHAVFGMTIFSVGLGRYLCGPPPAQGRSGRRSNA
ncbi:MAG: CPBP family intramembrane glutamic endopeptidase [Myxococcota bacterium]